MMNASTRRLSKIPDVVRAEIEPCFMDDRFAFQEDEASVSRIPKLNDDTADFCTSQLKVNKYHNIFILSPTSDF
jgi:fatty acyl-ACP thioesterase B